MWRVAFGDSFAIFIWRKWESHPNNFTFHSPSVKPSRSPSGKNPACVSRTVGFVCFVLFCTRPIGSSPATLQPSHSGPGLVHTWPDPCTSEGNSVGRRDSITLHFSTGKVAYRRIWDQSLGPNFFLAFFNVVPLKSLWADKLWSIAQPYVDAWTERLIFSSKLYLKGSLF